MESITDMVNLHGQKLNIIMDYFKMELDKVTEY